MQIAEQAKTWPFHETIVEAIRRCPTPSTGEIFRLFQLIKDTRIPKGHDKIIEAIDSYFKFPGKEKYSREIREVKESLFCQKKWIEMEGARKEKGDDILRFQTEAGELID